ncbi:MAG TPA: STAS domain-containing protein [Planctomycetaceae bacterium]|nr:STAS domain-containing protein [Planctomycetaceae bacterium]
MPRRTVPGAKAPSVASEEGVTVVTLGPEYESLEETELETLKGALLEVAERADPPLVVLDLSQLRFFGSALIEALFRAWNHLKGRPGGRLSLCGLTSYCREVVEITHLDQLWSIFETRAEAVNALKQSVPGRSG